MPDTWRAHVPTAKTYGPSLDRWWHGTILGPAASGELADLQRRPVTWTCSHRHRLARVAQECAVREARRRGGPREVTA